MYQEFLLGSMTVLLEAIIVLLDAIIVLFEAIIVLLEAIIVLLETIIVLLEAIIVLLEAIIDYVCLSLVTRKRNALQLIIIQQGLVYRKTNQHWISSLKSLVYWGSWVTQNVRRSSLQNISSIVLINQLWPSISFGRKLWPYIANSM